jgi:hypothetical protein
MYAGRSPENVDYQRLKKDPYFHIALRYTKGTNQNGNRANTLCPIGLSGGGLWVMPGLFAAQHSYLEAIAIEYCKPHRLIFFHSD